MLKIDSRNNSVRPVIDSGDLKVGILVQSLASQELWERRVGGILKGLGVVQHKFLLNDNIAKDIQRIEKMDDCDLLVCYAGGKVMELLSERQVYSRKIVDLELNILPIGLKILHSIPRGARAAVVMKHLRCANSLLREILNAGVTDKRFLICTHEEVHDLQVSYVITSEEMSTELERIMVSKGKNTPLLKIPRNLAFSSIGKLISAAEAILTAKAGGTGYTGTGDNSARSYYK